MSDRADAAPARAPEVVERFVKQLNITYKAVKLYPASSEIPAQSAAEALAALKTVLQEYPVVLIQVTRDGLSHEGSTVFPASEGMVAFGREFYARNLAEVRFHTGSGESEILKFLGLLASDAEALAAQGGFEASLWEMGVSNITVTEASTRVIERDFDADGEETPSVVEGEPWPPSYQRIDELMDGAAAGRPRDQRVLVRVLRDPTLLSSYLREAALGSRGTVPDADLSARIGALAHSIQFELPEDQASLMRAIADAVMTLEPEVRDRLFRVRLLEEARRDESVADIVRQLALEEVLDSILHEIQETPESVAGLSRAIRNLALINVSQSKEAVLAVASDKMRSAGASEGFISSVIEAAAPAKLTMAEQVRQRDPQPIENVLRLIDLAPTGDAVYAYDAAIAPLRTEASRGTTDGDVLGALVTLVTIERRPAQFSTLMSLLEDSVGLLVDTHEFEVAADTAEALGVLHDAPDLEEAQRERVLRVLEVLSLPETMKKVTAALRLYRHDSAEHAACRRLLAVLGSATIDSLLEVLAEEPDMAARKAVVDLVSGMADRFIPQLGSRIVDRRWYFVRNVVAILASTRSPDTLPHLQRTLHHTEPRVRRETIRALSAIRDPRSDQMLVAALADDDAQNVQLAARYLGSIRCRAAALALEEVARGTGRGNRETGPRVEAIEALGRIGASASVPVLQDLTRRRGFLGGKDRQVRAAAEAALSAMASGNAGEVIPREGA